MRLQALNLRLAAVAAWLLIMVMSVVSCERIEELLRSQQRSHSQAASTPAKDSPLVPQVLTPDRDLRFRISDYPLLGEPIKLLADFSVLVRPNRSGPKVIMKSKDEVKRELLEIVRGRLPWPFEIYMREDFPAGQRHWARVRITYHLRVDATNWDEGEWLEGSLRFKFGLAPSLPDGFTSNWANITRTLKYTRPFSQLRRTESDLQAMVTAMIPSLVVQDGTSVQRILTQLELRADLSKGRLHSVLKSDETLRGVFADGCIVTERQGKHLVYRLTSPLQQVLELAPHPQRILHCSDTGVHIIEADTQRAMMLYFEPWDDTLKGWRSFIKYERDIDLSSLEFMLDEDTLCLLGERHDVGARYAKFHCFDQHTGSPRWDQTVPGTDVEALAMDKGQLFVVAGRYLTILNMTTGDTIWRAQIKDATGMSGRNRGCFFNDTMVFSPDIGQFVSFDTHTRQAPWRLTTFGTGFLACDNLNGLYFDGANHTLLALDASTMEPRWRYRLPGPATDILFHGGHVLLLLPGALYVLDDNNGELAWQMPLPHRGDRLLRFQRRIYLVGGGDLFVLTRPDRI